MQKWWANPARETVKPKSMMVCLFPAFIPASTVTSGVHEPKMGKEIP